MIRNDAVEPPVSLAEAQAYVRVETGEEEAILAGLLRSASAMCEQFIGQAMVARGFDETIRVSGQWVRLGVTPVVSITSVTLIGEGAVETVLAASD